ncbi:MAG: M23 family metallopeptidase [Bacteroidaceae bacterium]|nr:M23 family metallopeptidase [Bacteroidaceae bacterium]
MRKVYYFYNPKTDSYERVYPSTSQRLWALARRLLILLFVFALSYFVLLFLLGVPTEKTLQQENGKLKAKLQVLSSRMDESLQLLKNIQQRDDNLYRVVFMADPIPDAVRNSTYLGTNRYEELINMPDSRLVTNVARKMDIIERELYVQSYSFDELVNLCKTHNQRLECIPAIQPISNKDLKRTASGYGYRRDPIYKTVKFHKGMDFAAKSGTDVFATGNGVVTFARWKTGYGNTVIIDHGFGYKTLYAHMKKILVRAGQKVVRGHVVGLVGTTGKSTGPHLHYEVRVKDRPVNPVNYYFMDLNAEDYEKMIQIAANHGKVFD